MTTHLRVRDSSSITGLALCPIDGKMRKLQNGRLLKKASKLHFIANSNKFQKEFQ